SDVQTILLLEGGLSLYDAVTVTFSTMSAAGFTTKNNSIAGFGSTYVDIVVTVFMAIGGMNFASTGGSSSARRKASSVTPSSGHIWESWGLRSSFPPHI
ncbi:MAG TPA: potassium transporter TrkG, partial [Sphaerochaeta sp.]|nr:potassium transporter TrkG [Sphaerochaeta sp.]